MFDHSIHRHLEVSLGNVHLQMIRLPGHQRLSGIRAVIDVVGVAPLHMESHVGIRIGVNPDAW